MPFTIIASLLSAFFTAGMFGFIELYPWLFITVGIIGLALGSIHLGKKLRAWRSVLNIKDSWLSREILFYGLFMAFSVFWYIFPEIVYFGYAGALLGFAACYAVDKVYTVFKKSTKLEINSASIFLSALLFTAILTLNEQYIIILSSLKLLLYTYRKIYFLRIQIPANYYLTIIRISFGFIIPIFIWNQLNIGVWEFIFASILIGEIIDRIEFYLEGEIISPKEQIAIDTKKMLNSMN